MDKSKLVQSKAVESKTNPDIKKAEGKPVKENQGITQREAVYTEVMRVIRDEKIMVADKQPVKPFLNETHVKKICAALVAGFQGKKIALKDTEANKKKLADSKAMGLYCLGLLNNWLRRDKRLNGVQSGK